MITYNVHNLIEVRVTERVPAVLRQAIDFQIAHFRQRRPAEVGARRIDVLPYDDWMGQQTSPGCAFHLCRGAQRRWMDDPERRTAYVVTDTGYRVYADTPAFLVNLLIQFLLVTQGMTLVHAAAVADPRGRVTLLPGPGGVGKTALLGQLVQHHGYRLLGDDVVAVTRLGRCLAFPRSFVLKRYHESVYPDLFKRLNITSAQTDRPVTVSIVNRLGNLIADNMPMKGLARYLLSRAGQLERVQRSLAMPRPQPYLATVPVQDVFGSGCVAPSGPIDRVVFLQRWSHTDFDASSMSEDAMAQRLFSIIHHEWTGHMRQFWTLGSLELIDLPRYFQTVYRTIRDAVRHTPCQRLLIPDDATPQQLLGKYLDHRPRHVKEAA